MGHGVRYFVLHIRIQHPKFNSNFSLFFLGSDYLHLYLRFIHQEFETRAFSLYLSRNQFTT
ncbi:hypothetical protein C2W62_03520 [Candidatus Entotheonella serta]|nr:hypothetical protein C2W62_03520 [Candidatus Entotheonella serta]